MTTGHRRWPGELLTPIVDHVIDHLARVPIFQILPRLACEADDPTLGNAGSLFEVAAALGRRAGELLAGIVDNLVDRLLGALLDVPLDPLRSSSGGIWSIIARPMMPAMSMPSSRSASRARMTAPTRPPPLLLMTPSPSGLHTTSGVAAGAAGAARRAFFCPGVFRPAIRRPFPTLCASSMSSGSR